MVIELNINFEWEEGCMKKMEEYVVGAIGGLKSCLRTSVLR